MLTIRDSHHIVTNRCLADHRACRAHTGFSLGAKEARRVRHEIIALINRQLRFAWLIGQWRLHEGDVKSRRAASRR
jgi:hypothetical protein